MTRHPNSCNAILWSTLSSAPSPRTPRLHFPPGCSGEVLALTSVLVTSPAFFYGGALPDRIPGTFGWLHISEAVTEQASGMEALVCRSGSNLLATPSTSKQPSSKTSSRSQSVLLSGPHPPHLFHIAAMSTQRIHFKQNERSLIVFAKGEQNSQLQSETFQAASPWSWISVGFGAALLVSTAFLPSASLGRLEFLREGLYRVGSPQLFQSLFYGGVVVHLVEATVAFYLARRVDPQYAALWFWQTFFLGFFSLSTLLQKSKQENVE